MELSVRERQKALTVTMAMLFRDSREIGLKIITN